jgi:hypothetical protein
MAVSPRSMSASQAFVLPEVAHPARSATVNSNNHILKNRIRSYSCSIKPAVNAQIHRIYFDIKGINCYFK